MRRRSSPNREAAGQKPPAAGGVPAAIGVRTRTGAHPFIEPVGQAGDAVEREADRMANAAVRGDLAGPMRQDWSAAAATGGAIQRVECREEEEEKIRRAPAAPAPAAPDVSGPAPEAASTHDASVPGASQPSEAAPVFIIDDESEAGRGQMRKSDFLAALRAEVCVSVDTALTGTGRDSQGCPWIDHWLGYYAGRTSAQIERALRQYASEARTATAAQDYIPIVSARVRTSAEVFARTGQVSGVPDDIPDSPMAGGGLLGTFGGMFFKARPGGARESDPVSIRKDLGGGRSLPGGLRTRMESAFGADFAGVRLHTDARGNALSDRLNARAFTVGHDVAFGPGEFRPGTIAGEALIAHELAHVMQQGGATSAAPLTKSSGGTGLLESDADRSAAAFVRQSWLGGRQVASNIAPRLRTGVTLSRCSKDKPAPTPTPSVASGTDFRAGTSLPDAGKQADVQRELHPTAAAGHGSALATWDAHSSSPGTAAAKAALKADLKAKVTKAMLDKLNEVMPKIKALSTSGRVPITSMEGPGNAAKKVVDSEFSPWISIAALTPSQSSLRHGFAFRASGPGQNLFDANDRTQRAAAGLAVNALDLAGWLAESFGSAAMKPHNFSPTRGGEEEAFLDHDIVGPFETAHHADLELFDLFGFAITDPSTGKIVTSTALDPALSNKPDSSGAPSPAERARRWSTWETLVHEYIHTLEHPVFHSAGGASNRIMSEGFCTMFSQEVLTNQIPKAPKDAGLRAEIEGGSFPEPPAGTVPPFKAGAYAEYLAGATAIRG